MPFWLAWTIGSIPLLFIAFWIWHQRRYRKKLELQSSPA
jgi:ABC-type xylose transport system permease subunit